MVKTHWKNEEYPLNILSTIVKSDPLNYGENTLKNVENESTQQSGKHNEKPSSLKNILVVKMTKQFDFFHHFPHSKKITGI